jgi:hypothetical protein
MYGVRTLKVGFASSAMTTHLKSPKKEILSTKSQ